jgi:hypothetical protein
MVDLNAIRVDMSRITVREYRALFDKNQPQAEEDSTIAKACGLTVDELLDLSQPDYRRLAKRFFDAAREPLDDPN